MKTFSRMNHWRALFFCMALFLFVIGQNTYAAVIPPNTIISVDTIYSNDTLDMSNGSFIIKNGAILTIENCTINGTISTTNQTLVTIDNGKLILSNNTIQISSGGIGPTPFSLTPYSVVKVNQGMAEITGNSAEVDTFYTVGFLRTNPNFTTDGLKVIGNNLSQFHGPLYLFNSDHADISENIFFRCSYANIFTNGMNSSIRLNEFKLPGNNSSGNVVIVVGSEGTVINANSIQSGACYGISVGGSNNITISNNSVNDSLSYGISIDHEQTLGLGEDEANFIKQMKQKYHIKKLASTNITITGNILGQNRYGIVAGVVDHLVVKNNIFVQKFPDAKSRRFWTNNAILLPFVTNLTWVNNFYKEAFTQDIKGDNTQAKKFVTFPQSGGVVL